MGYFVNPYAITGYVATLAAWTMAYVVYTSGPATRQTRILALLLAVEGVSTWGGLAGMWSTDSAADAYGWQMVGMVGAVCLPAVYVWFLATLNTPLARPLRPLPVKLVVTLVSAATAIFLLLRPELFAASVVRVWWAPWEVVPGPLWNTVLSLFGMPSLYAIAVAFDAWRRTARNTDARTRAAFYLLAFGVRDLIWGLLYFTAPLWFQRLQPASDLFVIALLPGATLLFSALLAYGVLRAQLFDIDVRVRRGVRRGTLAGVFLAAFILVSEIAQNYVSASFGYVAGGIAAALLFLVVSPLQRFSERVAEVAIPATRTTPEYLAFRKLEVYKAAVESARETGGVSAKERATLGRLREKLGVSDVDAAAIEQDVGFYRDAPVQAA